MNRFYANWHRTAQDRAISSGLYWNPEFSETDGKIDLKQRWNLMLMIGLSPPPTYWLGRFSHTDEDMKAYKTIIMGQKIEHEPPVLMSLPWREFLQAALIHVLLINRNKAGQAVAVMRAIRTLSLAAGEVPPWELTAADVQRAYNIALRIGTSGKSALNVKMVVMMLFDREHLGKYSPLSSYATAFTDATSRAAEASVNEQKIREGSNYNIHSMRSSLADRKSPERLPETQAFWELVRIVFTETPLTFTDRIRFAALKIQIVTGLRIGESALIPLDCIRWRDYFDASGQPAGQKGGISRSLRLRYFALKQDVEQVGSKARLVERFQDVPTIYEKLILEIQEEIANCTAPLRERLQLQSETGRIIPEYDPSALVGAIEMYSRVAGSVRNSDEPIPPQMIAAYRSEHSVSELRKIREHQEKNRAVAGIKTVRNYWRSQSAGPTARHALGDPIFGKIDYRQASFRVSDIEEFITNSMPTKLSDTTPFIAPDGSPFYPHQFLFLHPSRSLIEGRDGGIIDIERYFSVGRLAPSDLQFQVSNRKDSLFARYGKTTEDQQLSLNTHSTRHLQTTELFRLGVADTAITKRFGRNTTAQSYTYDHRSLAENLASIDLPEAAREAIPERAHDTLRMFLAGEVRGPIVDEFKRVQDTKGDQAAFEYLAAEADGLHATPYGFCLSSFVVDPCPKHLQCFNGCRHLARTDNPAEQENLIKLRDRTSEVLKRAQTSSSSTIGRKNQIAHAEEVLVNVTTALAATPGKRIFPDGQDLSAPFGRPSTIIDAAVKNERDI